MCTAPPTLAEQRYLKYHGGVSSAVYEVGRMNKQDLPKDIREGLDNGVLSNAQMGDLLRMTGHQPATILPPPKPRRPWKAVLGVAFVALLVVVIWFAARG